MTLTPAARVIADAVAAVIAARIAQALADHGIHAEPAAKTAQLQAAAAVEDLLGDGWHITTPPYPLNPEGRPR